MTAEHIAEDLWLGIVDPTLPPNVMLFEDSAATLANPQPIAHAEDGDAELYAMGRSLWASFTPEQRAEFAV